ncbi:MAG TPA: tetratricopeptide repeat protein [Bryobacteraceae bacterium]|nr:tetratricopeptide repeat protein [Bryobacteraceae bacterium]
MSRGPCFIGCLLCVWASARLAAAPGPDFQAALAALQHGDAATAEQKLRAELATHPDEPDAMGLLGVALRHQQKSAEADAVFERLATATENDAKLSSAIGIQLAQAGEFAAAERFLIHALAPDPANFELQYQLGIVAMRAGHNDRAKEVLENALRNQPKNVDVLYALAYVDHALRQNEAAIRVLSDAAHLAPQRADIQKLLGVITGDLLAYEDSVAAWERYMKLAPDDDIGRRERGFAKTNMKQAEGIADLEWFVSRHPDDPTGLFELGVAQGGSDPDQGIATLTKAINVRPDFADARAARGALEYQQNNGDAALADLEFAASKQPDNAVILDHLGQTYLLLDRPKDAVPVLLHAAALAPSDAKTQLHTANALAQSGDTGQSKIYMARYKQLGGTAAVPARGVLEFLSQTPEQQHADYRARVEKAVAEHPADATMQVNYLKLSITDGNIPQAEAAARKILALKPGAMLLTDAGRAMLTAQQYPLAKDLLEQAASSEGATGIDLDLATALFHTTGAAAGLQQLDKVPAGARGGDYYAVRARMLPPAEAIAAMKQAVENEPQRIDLDWQGAALMVKNNHADAALQLLNATGVPDNAEIAAMRALLLDISAKSADARKLLADARRRWPESAPVWLAQASIEGAHGLAAEAKKSGETAARLGAHGAPADPRTLLLRAEPAAW